MEDKVELEETEETGVTEEMPVMQVQAAMEVSYFHTKMK
jgi:hypothetical protein